jgi:hypothetical protein
MMLWPSVFRACALIWAISFSASATCARDISPTPETQAWKNWRLQDEFDFFLQPFGCEREPTKEQSYKISDAIWLSYSCKHLATLAGSIESKAIGSPNWILIQSAGIGWGGYLVGFIYQTPQDTWRAYVRHDSVISRPSGVTASDFFMDDPANIELKDPEKVTAIFDSAGQRDLILEDVWAMDGAAVFVTVARAGKYTRFAINNPPDFDQMQSVDGPEYDDARHAARLAHLIYELLPSAPYNQYK